MSHNSLHTHSVFNDEGPGDEVPGSAISREEIRRIPRYVHFSDEKIDEIRTSLVLLSVLSYTYFMETHQILTFDERT